jgi:hypothetical protein
MSDIVPKIETTTKTVVRFTMFISQLVLNTSASFRVFTYDIKDEIVDNVIVSLEGEAYTAWGNNDDYVIKYIASQLGFTLLP